MAQKHLNRAIVNLVAQNHYYYCCSCLRELKIGIFFFSHKSNFILFGGVIFNSNRIIPFFRNVLFENSRKTQMVFMCITFVCGIFFYFVNKVFVAWFAIYSIQHRTSMKNGNTLSENGSMKTPNPKRFNILASHSFYFEKSSDVFS